MKEITYFIIGLLCGVIIGILTFLSEVTKLNIEVFKKLWKILNE